MMFQASSPVVEISLLTRPQTTVLPDHSRGHTVHPDVIYSSLGGEGFSEPQQGGLTDGVRSEGRYSLVASDRADEDCRAPSSSLDECSHLGTNGDI